MTDVSFIDRNKEKKKENKHQLEIEKYAKSQKYFLNKLLINSVKNEIFKVWIYTLWWHELISITLNREIYFKYVNFAMKIVLVI